MKQQLHLKLNSNHFKLALIALAAALLTACGTSKSNPPSTSPTAYDFTSTKLLANCNKAKDENFSFNTASVTDSNGQYSSEWIKLKFNFLSTSVTASGNTIKFFKWRVVGGSAQMDSAPLSFAKYDISTGQILGSTVTSMNALEISATHGYYIQLNDPYTQFQVLKAVVYNSSGSVVAHINTLIPGFAASPTDYQYNSDGTARSVTLQEMHALYGQSVSGMTQLQMQQQFDAFCF